MTNQTKNNKLNYLIDPTFTKVNRLFLLSFENENDRTCFSKYYVSNVQTKDFNVLIHGKWFFDVLIKMKKKHTNSLLKWEEIIITRQIIYWTMNTIRIFLIAIDLSKQIELENRDLKQQISFIGKPEDDRAMFFIIEKSEETPFEFTQNAATVVWFWLPVKMGTQKIVNLLGDAGSKSSKFATRKWYVMNDQHNTDYGEGNERGTTVVIIQTHIFL